MTVLPFTGGSREPLISVTDVESRARYTVKRDPNGYTIEGPRKVLAPGWTHHGGLYDDIEEAEEIASLMNYARDVALQEQAAELVTSGQEHLLTANQYDRALRDLMPVIEWLTAADLYRTDGMFDTSARALRSAFNEFLKVPTGSPAVSAYLRWLEQNTMAQEPGE